jgi:hypothetical protein
MSRDTDIPQGPDADMALVERVLTAQIGEAVADITSAMLDRNHGTFVRKFPIAGSKWSIEHTPVFQGTLCIGYTVKVTQDWRTGHIPEHFVLLEDVLGANGYTSMVSKLNVVSALRVFA